MIVVIPAGMVPISNFFITKYEPKHMENRDTINPIYPISFKGIEE
jgi:hypothetical protein